MSLNDNSGHARRIASLDGIRGIAVLLVTMFHFLTIADPNRGIRALPFKIAQAGWSGVDLFFVLSGFLITTILWNSKQQEGYFRSFYMRRVLRIFPLYYGVLAIVLLIVPAIDHLRTPPVDALLHKQALFWLYISNFSTQSLIGDWLNLGHFWSLAIEEQFYLLWPGIIFLSSRKRAITIAALAAVLSIALRIALQWYAWQHPALQQPAQAAAFSWTPCRLDALAIGALIALLSLEPASRAMVERVGRSAGLLACVTIVWMIWRGSMNAVFAAPHSISNVAAAALMYTVIAAAFGAIVIEATRRQTSIVARAVSIFPFRFLGKYSYGIYVFQGVLAPALERIFYKQVSLAAHSDLAAISYFACCSAVVIAVSVLSWHAYEQRFLRLKRLFPRRGDVHVAAPA